ncbi:MAG: haloacid dehalogenase-like hydrolase [Patescibacteria group bacterium]
MNLAQLECVRRAVRLYGTDMVVSDLDGTIMVWQGLLEMNDLIAKHFPEKRAIVEPLQHLQHEYKMRRYDFETLVADTLKVQGLIFHGLKQSVVRGYAEALAKEKLSQVYAFPSTLIRAVVNMQGQARKPVLVVTGSPQEFAEPFCKALGGVDIVAGSIYQTADGIYTGERIEITAIHKDQVMDKLELELGVTWYIGMGDSMSDWPLLTRAKNGLAINPNKHLLDHIRRNPQHGIIRVSDHQKDGIQFFKFDDLGRQREITIHEALPPDLALAMHNLPGLWNGNVESHS